MNDIQELKDMIQVGWKVEITDHDYLNNSGTATITEITEFGMTLTRRYPVSSQGRSFPSMLLSWDLKDGDKHVREGNTIHFYVMGRAITSRSTPGVHRLCKSYKFIAPTGS